MVQGDESGSGNPDPYQKIPRVLSIGLGFTCS